MSHGANGNNGHAGGGGGGGGGEFETGDFLDGSNCRELTILDSLRRKAEDAGGDGEGGVYCAAHVVKNI